MQIRCMDLNDIDQVVTISQMIFAVPWKKEDFQYELTTHPSALYYVIENQDEILGYIGMWHFYEQAQIATFGIHKDYQRQGLGQMLLSYTIEQARKRDVETLSLEVRQSNIKARTIYEKNGFVDAAIRKNYYQDNHEDAILMIKELEGQS